MAAIGIPPWARALPLALTLANAAGAQTRVVRGIVTDGRDQPVSAATVIVAGHAPAITDDSGRFRLEIGHRDKVVFDVRRVGYMPSRFGVASGGDTTVSVLLLPAGQRLPGVEVTDVAPRPPSLAGFEQRMLDRKRGAGSGHFITAKDIEASPVTRASQVVENIPSIIVRRVELDRYAIFGRIVGGSECPATLYLDGIRITGGDLMTIRRGRSTSTRDAGAPIDQYVTPPEIAGVEVYARGAFAPPQFQPPADAAALKCAIVVFWTKHRER